MLHEGKSQFLDQLVEHALCLLNLHQELKLSPRKKDQSPCYWKGPP